MEKTYKIIRHRFEGENEVIATGLTLEQAQAHCQREDTHGDGWFDGYDRDNLTPDERLERQFDDMRLELAVERVKGLGI